MKKLARILCYPLIKWNELFNYYFENETRPWFIPRFAWVGRSGILLFIALVIGYFILLGIAILVCSYWWESPYIELSQAAKRGAN